ncbi:hypothetical protein [Amylibacter sp. IMCC11727]|uniref:hypothetical protein n=1 Tax=Amylibacter sp. IMCC11727 TaxID=3039851 RepID=UPI00244DBAEB|nr:hypothetical protein [Amylibacter sp. IMCC11727]WGI21300.1 hypothetical protein QBD29_14445 [Amylibacter sp. IMCC11727]
MGERLIPPRVNQDGVRRADVKEPDWVVLAMYARWPVFGLLVIPVAIWQSTFLWVALICGWFGFSHLIYLIYRRQDPTAAEIVFKNEEDGYNSEGGDGDGGDGD